MEAAKAAVSEEEEDAVEDVGAAKVAANDKTGRSK